MKKGVHESKTEVPRGTATHLPEGASLRRYARETLLSTFFRWGYREVVTPVFEYLDVLSEGLSGGLLEKSYKFVDRESGKIMLLRPDITPQVARMVAGIFADEPKPLRFCYHGNIFRYEESHAGREREIFQVGCELVGTSSLEADAEIIAVASEGIRRIGIEDFKIVIGQIGYLHGIIAYLKSTLTNGLSTDHERLLMEAISKKDVDLIGSVLDISGVSERVKRNILQIPSLFGREEVFHRALQIADNRESIDAIENLREVYSILCLYDLEDYILFDLCDIRGIDYYTGLFFEIFSPGISYPIGRGGRYDNLIGRFGYDCPSTGFAIDVESIILSMERKGGHLVDTGIDFLIAGGTKDKRRTIELARRLREKGYSVIMDTGLKDVESSIEFALKKDVEKVLVIEDDRGRKATLIDVKTGKRSEVYKDKIGMRERK